MKFLKIHLRLGCRVETACIETYDGRCIVASIQYLKLQQLFLKKSADIASYSWLMLAFKATKFGWLVAWPQERTIWRIYGIVQRIQTWGTWRPNGPGPVLCQIYFIKAWVVLALLVGLDRVLTCICTEQIFDYRQCMYKKIFLK